MRRIALLLLVVCSVPLRADAQAASDTLALKVSPAIGIHYGVPLRLSLATGGLFDFRGRPNDGVITMVEAGQGGVELSMGYFRMRRFGQGYSFRLAGIRTNERPWNASGKTTYLGAEAHWMLLVGVGGRIGWFRRASGNSGEGLKDNLGTIGLSIGA